jgi:photosystem II stability/assembly factor-like uncharacterized protein
MKTPAAPTRAVLERDAASAAPAARPWGDAPARVVVEMPEEATRSTVRERLKARVHDACPEGKVFERLRYFGLQRGLPAPARPSLGGAREAPSPAVRKRVRELAAAVKSPPAPAFKTAAQLPAWRELGPTLIPHGQTYGSGTGASPSVSGRCTAIVVDRSDSRHLVLCSAGGGLWGSRDGGAGWAPLTDRQPTLVMGAVAQSVSSPHVLYAGTGDGDGQIPYGVGLLRSSDGGQAWSLVPSAALLGVGVYDLAIDPGDHLRVFIGSTAGLHLSTDGGATVRTLLDGPVWSVSINSANPREVFAAGTTGLMRSLNGGTTFSKVTLPGGATRYSRLEVAHGTAQPDVVWVAGCAQNHALLWRRATAGAAFAAEAVPSGMKLAQAWYDWCLAVAPHDADLVYWGAIDLYRGKRGASGIAWGKISSRTNGDSIHPDQHGLAFDPADPRIVYACNDGGVFRSPDGGDHWQSLNPGLGITEFEFLAQLDSDPAWLLGGTQDNGTLANAGLRHWDQIALGDGGDCASVDRGGASICYHSFYDMPIEKAAAHGAQAFGWVDASPPTPDGYAALFYPPMEAGGRILVKAGATVWVSADEGANWDEVELPTSNDADPDLASALAIVGESIVLVGTTAGRMYRIDRGAIGWSGAGVTALGKLGNQYVSDIAVVNTTARTLWVSCSQAGAGHVFRSTDGGKTWTDRSARLPDVAVNALVIDPKNSKVLYAATDRGVFRTKNAGTAWSDFGNGLPNVIVGDLILHASARLLRAGTRSRGAWEVAV